MRLARYPSIPVVTLRHVGSWDRAPLAFRELLRWSKQRGVRGALDCLVPDDPDITHEDKLRLDACVECAAVAPLALGMSAKLIPAGLFAVTTQRGSWSTLTDSYDALIGQWLPNPRFQLAAEPIVETYLDGPEVAEVERRTEVRVRVC